MKNFSQSIFTKAIGYLVLLIIVITAAAIVFLPGVVDWYMKESGAEGNRVRTILLVLLYPCGIMAALTEWEVFKIFKSVNQNNPFVRENVKAFRRIAIYLFVIAAMFIVKIFMLNTLMTMLGAFGFVVVGLLMLVLSDVFHQAVVYKEDNDLTI